MERERWWRLYTLARELSRGIHRGIQFRVADIVGVFLWAVIHDRPVSWACRRENWPTDGPFRWLPSQSNMSRRLRTRPVIDLLQAMEQALGTPQSEWLKTIDAKPLPVGASSKDGEARWGRAHRGRVSMNGYKLFTIWGDGPLPIAWYVGGMNEAETKVAERLTPALQGAGYLLGDVRYDSNQLFDAAGERGHQLVAQRAHPHADLGHRRHSSFRLRSIELLQGKFGKALYRMRNDIERKYAWLTSFGGGLSPLPSWVRSLHRVRQWVQAKLLINAVRMLALAYA